VTLQKTGEMVAENSALTNYILKHIKIENMFQLGYSYFKL